MCVRKRERERECEFVCVCLCVCVREREREREREGTAEIMSMPSLLIVLGMTVSQDALEYSLSGTSQSIAGLEYFWINPATGYVHIIKSLTLDFSNARSYRVRTMLVCHVATGYCHWICQ